MNNEKKLYDICLKMIKDKHQLNEYSIDKFNTFYFQVFNNSSDTDNINDLNKAVLKKINEDIIYNSSKGLTFFAIGLMKETLNHFNVKGSITIDKSFDATMGVKFIIELE